MLEQIQYRKLQAQYVITERKAVDSRQEIFNHLVRLRQQLPVHLITGSAFCVFYYVTSVDKGDDVEYGYPVVNAEELNAFHPHLSAPIEVLEYLHIGTIQDLGKSYQKLGQWTRDHGILSEEFIREEYPENNGEIGQKDECKEIGSCVRIQFVIHNWMAKFTAKVNEQLSETLRPIITEGSEAMEFQSAELTKFQWIQAMLNRLDNHTTESQKYEILSRCSHVFPQELIVKARHVYEQARKSTGDYLMAVDETLKFMKQDHGWGSVPIREGYTLFEEKSPRDPKGYAAGITLADRRKAYCFCPLIRNHLEEAIPECFCNCGLGWYRQQWEGILQQPLRIERHHSLLRGDDHCSFKIHLPERL